MSNEQFEHLFSKIKEVPALPDVVVKVMRMTRDPDVTAGQLTAVIGQDPALTVNILKLCNSAYYGLPRVVSSVTQAITYLGFHTVRNLVLTCALSDLLAADQEIYGHGKGGLWLHSYACATASEKLCEKSRPGLKDTAFTAGLLRAVGKVIIHDQTKDTVSTLVELMTTQNLTLIEAETNVLGYTHTEIGAAVARRWNFPAELVHAIQYHIDPTLAPNHSLSTWVVHVAGSGMLSRNVGVELEQICYPVQPEAYDEIGLSAEQVDELLDPVPEEISSVAGMLSG